MLPNSDESATRFYNGNKMKWLSTIGLLAILMVAGCDSGPKTKSAEASRRDIGTVDLAVNFGETPDPIAVAVVCSEDSTVLSILERAHNMKELNLKFRGQGETAFVESINGIKNEGASGKNWIYRVNGKTGDKSAGIYEVDPQDKVSWQFGTPPKELVSPQSDVN